MTKKIKDMTAMQFGRLTVLEFAGMGSLRTATWKCLCKCGKSVVVRGVFLRRGATQSCGCLRIEVAKTNATHGMKNTREYGIWSGMVSRCSNPNATGYQNYGGRGITICDAWIKFSSFYADMGNAPIGMTLERIDNGLGYFKENCRWATRTEQSRNKRNTIRIEAFGKTMSVADWADEIGVRYQTLYRRLGKPGWSIEKSLTYGVCK